MGTYLNDPDTCVPFRDDLAEFALGTLSGRARADVIDHLERCAECAAELESLSAAADALLLVAPEATPPAGFDEHALVGMTGRRDRHRSSSARVLALAAGVLIALGVGIGAIVTRQAGHDPSFTSAALVSSTGTKGQVFLSWGRDAWMFMTLDNVNAAGPIACTVTLRNGARETVGHFVVRSGYGAWAVALKVPASALRSVAVVDQAGVTIASASISI